VQPLTRPLKIQKMSTSTRPVGCVIRTIFSKSDTRRSFVSRYGSSPSPCEASNEDFLSVILTAVCLDVSHANNMQYNRARVHIRPLQTTDYRAIPRGHAMRYSWVALAMTRSYSYLPAQKKKLYRDREATKLSNEHSNASKPVQFVSIVRPRFVIDA
jgi:hypothetical protein